ncbi:MAG: SPOR domain-containing protein [Acidobacteriota bacterium]|nr:SPOR domain-containing protein [Acidobacteriota bacterium]
MPPVCLALMVLFFWLVTCSVQATAGDYAVQIAAVRSQQCADDLRMGLHARGLDAYWVRIVLPQHGLFYRVRLGKFPSLETAYSYAESLLDSGLLESYAITNYEKPNSAQLADITQASMEVQEYIQQRPTPRETSDLLAAIGARQWWLPGNRSLFANTPKLPPANAGMTQREVLVYALSRHEWRLSQDLSVLFVRAPVVASSTDLVINQPAQRFEAASSPTVPVERTFAPASSPLTPPPQPETSMSPVAVVSNPTPASNKAFSDSRNASTGIGRGTTTARKPVTYGRFNPPRLQASAEMRNGQLVMRIRNLDADRPFAGTAKVTISDDRRSNDLAPMKFDVNPEDEILVPINETVADGNDWMLMVYDEGGALRMIRGQTIGQKPAPPVQQAQTPAPQPGQFELSPPPYVTGVFDATNAAGQIPAVGTVPGADPTRSSNQNMAVPSEAGAATQTPPVDPTAPAQLTITPRLIAATTENVTLEFEIAAPQPLQYISLTLAAGEHRDTRQALMSTTRGRVPFLIPATQAQGTFLYEIKDESGRVLAGGTGDFRQLTGR